MSIVKGYGLVSEKELEKVWPGFKTWMHWFFQLEKSNDRSTDGSCWAYLLSFLVLSFAARHGMRRNGLKIVKSVSYVA